MSGLIRFRIENSWIESNNLDGSDIKIVKWNGNQWTQIETVEKTRDDKYTYYEAKTETLSEFAITGSKGIVVVPTTTPTVAVTETLAKLTGTATSTAPPTPMPTKKVPGFEFALAIAILSVTYLSGRKRR